MKRLRATFLILFLASLTCPIWALDPLRLDGSIWAVMSTPEKNLYLAGIVAGIEVARPPGEGEPLQMSEEVVWAFVEKVDDFYKTTGHREYPIPTVVVLMYDWMEAGQPTGVPDYLEPIPLRRY